MLPENITRRFPVDLTDYLVFEIWNMLRKGLPMTVPPEYLPAGEVAAAWRLRIPDVTNEEVAALVPCLREEHLRGPVSAYRAGQLSAMGRPHSDR